MTEITPGILLSSGQGAEGNVAPAGHCSKTLVHANVRRWLGNGINKASLLLDLAFRVDVDLGLAVMVARKGEWDVLNVLNSRFRAPSQFKPCTQKPRVHITLVGRWLGSPHQAQISDQISRQITGLR